jgi:hypothetical protein
MGSDRHFGLVFSLVFLIVALWPAGGELGWSLRGITMDALADIAGRASEWLRFWALWVSAAFLLPAWIRPEVLHPLNRIWYRIGLLLGRVVSPIVLGAVFLATVVPTGLILRAFGKDLLRLRRDPRAVTYWIDRPRHDGKDASRHSMRNPY